eukprot:sb/3469488/
MSTQLTILLSPGSVPSLQALCRLKIRRVAGPEGLNRLQTLQQPPDTPFLRNTTRPNNTELSHIKRKTSLLQDRKPSLVEDNRDGEEKYRSREVMVVEAAELMPSPIRRYLLHCDEYELWWDQKQQNKKFAFAASVGGDSSPPKDIQLPSYSPPPTHDLAEGVVSDVVLCSEVSCLYLSLSISLSLFIILNPLVLYCNPLCISLSIFLPLSRLSLSLSLSLPLSPLSPL